MQDTDTALALVDSPRQKMGSKEQLTHELVAGVNKWPEIEAKLTEAGPSGVSIQSGDPALVRTGSRQTRC